MAVTDALIGQQIGGYRITGLVGRGGMGSVYRARDDIGQQDIALKLLLVDWSTDGREVERFAREARLVAKLEHANVVTVYGTGREEGYLYLAMELVEGRSLRALIRGRKGGMPLDQVLEIAGQVLEALKAAHAQGIIHRDIKPENILIKEDGTVKVLDFGVAKLEGAAALTRVDEILGTVEYMAPEQLLGDPYGPAVDLYAVGVVLYEMLTGRLPFSGDSPATLVYHQLNEEPHAPSFLSPAVPRALDRFVLRSLDKLPENRHPSAFAALEALREIQRHQQLVSLPGLESAPEGGQEEEEFRTRDWRPRFTGRQGELASLAAHFHALTAQGGRVVFLSGEAGIGKTRLLEKLAAYARERGGWVIQGSCLFEHGMGPYMPFLDAIGNLLGEHEGGLSQATRERLHQFLGEQAPQLAELVSTSSTTAKVRAGFTAAFGAEVNPEAARQRLFDTVFELLALVAAERPGVLLLEDVHWADEGSLQLLQYLARRAPEIQLLGVATYRPEELAGKEAEPAALASILQQLRADGPFNEVSLPRFAQEELDRLVRSIFLEADFSEEFSGFLYAQSQGNPFIALEVMRLLRSQDVLYCDSGVWSVRAALSEVAVPDRVNALIMRRVAQLVPEHRELLQTAAVIGQRFASGLLEASAGMSRMALLRALFKLEKGTQLIVSTAGGYEFSHSKIREVLYAEIPWELRREYHRIIASVLEKQPDQMSQAGADDLALHFYRAEEFARAVPHLLGCANEAFRLFSWRRAATLFAWAADACRQSGAAADSLIQALRLFSISSIYLTEYDKALEGLVEMREVARRAGQREEEAEALKLVAKVHEQARRFPEAVAACEEALAVLEGAQAPVVRARVLINWGCIDFECGRYAAAESRWHEVLALTQGRALREQAEASNNLAVLATMRGQLAEAWRLYEEVLSLQTQGQTSPQAVLTYYNMGMLRADQERWDEALELYDRSLEVCRATHYLNHAPVIELNRAEALMGNGNLVAAREACSQALRGFRRLDDALGVADALRLYGRLCRLERNWEDARTYLEKSVEINRQFGESISLGEAFYELGLLHRDGGRPAAALEPWRQAERIFAQAEAAPDLERVRAALEELVST